MSDTPYFDAYERRRQQTASTNDYTIVYGETSLISNSSNLISDSSLETNYIRTTNSSVTFTENPRYRLQKFYDTGIDPAGNTVSILKDVSLEMFDSYTREWRVV